MLSGSPGGYSRPSIRHDGRVLAVGSNLGVVLWDLARGEELSFLPIGSTSHALFEASGDLLTLTPGTLGVQRWPVQLDPIRGEFRIGPPLRLSFPVESAGLSVDGPRAHRGHGRLCSATHVLTPVKAFKVGPLDNCRYVAVSPDGKMAGDRQPRQQRAQVWQISDGALVANLKVEGLSAWPSAPTENG